MSANLNDFRTTLPPLPKVEKPKIVKTKKNSIISTELREIDKLLEMQTRKPILGGLGHEFDNLGKQLEDIDSKLRELERL